MKKTFYYFTIAFISLVGWSSCERIEVNNDDKENPLELSIVSNENRIELSWTKTNVSTFQNYVIIRSPEPFPEGFTSPNMMTFPMELIGLIEDIDENTYEDFASVLSDKVYYRVFANIGSRFLSSGDVEASIDLDVLPFQHSVVTFSPDLDQLFFIEENSSEFTVHKKNYKTKASSSSVLSSVNNYYIDLFMGNSANGEPELFASNDYDDEFVTYSPSDLTSKQTYYPYNDIYSIATSSSGLICAAVEDYQNSIHVYAPGNPTALERYNYSNYYSIRRLASISNTENEFIEANNSDLHYYKFSENGSLISHTTTIIGGTSVNEKIAVSPDNKYFIAHQNGVIYNKDLTIFKTIDNQGFNVAYVDFAFSENGQKLYVVDAFAQKIRIYNFPELQLEREVVLGYVPLRLFFDEGNLIVIGRGFHSQSNTYRSVFQVFDF